MTGFAPPARGHHHHLLKTPKTKVPEKANKKQTVSFAYCSLLPERGSLLSLPKKTVVGPPSIQNGTDKVEDEKGLRLKPKPY
jgi:hypothetical protein